MPHFGHEPGLSETTSVSMGQIHTAFAAALGRGDLAGAGAAAGEGFGGAGVLSAESAALRLDSESIRKLAEVTTRSPSARPESTV